MKEVSSHPIGTILVLSTASLVVFLITGKEFLIWLAVGFGFVGTFSITLSSFIHQVWMSVGLLLGRITSKFFLILIYLLVLCPLSALTKVLRRKSPINLDHDRRSMYVEREDLILPGSFEKPW